MTDSAGRPGETEAVGALLDALNNGARRDAIRNRVQARIVYTPAPPHLAESCPHDWVCEVGFDLDESEPLVQGWADDALGAALAAAEEVMALLAVTVGWDVPDPEATRD